MHVLDDQQHRAVQASHIPVQSLQAAPMDNSAVDQLPWIALAPCGHVNSKLLEKELLIKRCLIERYKIMITIHRGKTFVDGCNHCQIIHLDHLLTVFRW